MANLRKQKPTLRGIFVFALLLACLFFPFYRECNAQLRYDSPMYHDPEIEYGTSDNYFIPGLKDLWIKAIRRPSPELQVQAADAFARAHQLGLDELADVVPELLRVFRAENVDPTARLACARALVELDATEAAADFFALIDDSPLDLSIVMETAFARWKFEPVVEIWMRRLDSDAVFSERRILAIRGLAALDHQPCIPKLNSLAANQQLSSKLRLCAAEALSSLAPDGQVDLAVSLFENRPDTLINQMVAARLLQRTQDPSALPLLHEMLGSSNQAINVIAAESIWRIDQTKLLPQTASLKSHRSPTLRRLAVEVLALQPDASSVNELLSLLDDAHPEVRSEARQQLEAFLSEDQFTDQIWAHTEDILATRRERDDWRVLEQAMLLVGNMNHKPLAILLPPHLGTARHEVCTTAAWAIRTLNVPETFEPSLDYCRHVYDQRAVDLIDWPRQEELVHLFQMFGLRKYDPAEPLLRRFIPKDLSLGSDSRGAAIWALGYLHEDVPDDELAAELLVRVNDRNSPNPELSIVRRMCINAFGRMMCEDLLDDLRFSQKVDSYRTRYTAAWAINRITGEPIPEPPVSRQKIGVWFLEPILSLHR